MKLTNEEIRIVRINLGVNQYRFGGIVGVSPALIGHIERGDRTLTAAVEKKIREALPLTDDDIQTIVSAHQAINRKAVGLR